MGSFFHKGYNWVFSSTRGTTGYFLPQGVQLDIFFHKGYYWVFSSMRGTIGYFLLLEVHFGVFFHQRYNLNSPNNLLAQKFFFRSASMSQVYLNNPNGNDSLLGQTKYWHSQEGKK